jgi:hypothetical protein
MAYSPLMKNTVTNLVETPRLGETLQTEQLFSKDPVLYTLSERSGTSAGGVEIAALRKTITLKSANPKILITAMINGEPDGADMVLALRRSIGGGTEVEIGSATNPGNARGYGMVALNYDAEHGTTPSNHIINYLDTPTAAVGVDIVYKIYGISTHSTTTQYRLNSSYDIANAINREAISSTVTLTEINNTTGTTIALPQTGQVIVQVSHAYAGGGANDPSSGNADGRQFINEVDLDQAGAEIHGLEINFTPKYANSKILLTAMINHNGTYVVSFGFKRDSSLLGTSGSAPPAETADHDHSNANAKNSSSQGAIVTLYAGLGTSTFSNIYNTNYEYLDIATNTNARTYKAVGCSSWTGTSRHFFINDRWSSGLASGMACLSSMTIYEIAQ